MPRNVRNFWLDVQVDGRSSIGLGPVAKDGGFSAQLKVRDAGSVRDALSINGYAYQDGRLQVNIFDGAGNILHTLETHR